MVKNLSRKMAQEVQSLPANGGARGDQGFLRIFAANLLILARPGWAGMLSNSI